MRELSISKSLINGFKDYKAGELCGIQFREAYLNRSISLPSSDAKDCGQWFEFWCTGQTPSYPGNNHIEYDKATFPHIPEQVRHRVKDKFMMPELQLTAKGQMYADDAKAWKQSQNFHKYIEGMDIQILGIGEKIKLRDLTGTLDIRAKYRGVECIIDLKYSGLIDNKWDDLGWEKLSLPSKGKNTIQAFHYVYITGLPFFWMIFGTDKNEDCKFYQADISEEGLAQHAQNVDTFRAWLWAEINNGFKAIPSLTACRSCPLKDSCPDAVSFPIPEIIKL